MPDALHQQRHRDRSGDEPNGPASADQAQRQQRKVLLGTAHTEQQALQPARKQQEGRTEEQGIDFDDGRHDAFLAVSGECAASA